MTTRTVASSARSPQHAAPTSLQTCLEPVLELIPLLIGAPVAEVTLAHDDQEQRFIGGDDRDDRSPETAVPLDSSLSGVMIRTDAPLLLTDGDPDVDLSLLAIAQGRGLASMAAVPLHSTQGAVIGALMVGDHGRRVWSPNDVRILTRTASIVSMLAVQEQSKGRSDTAEPGDAADAAGIEAPFQLLVESSVAGICMLREDEMVFVNPRFGEIFGYTPEEALAHGSIEDFAAPEDRARLHRGLHSSASPSKNDIQIAFRAVRKDGRHIHVHLSARRVVSAPSTVLVGILVDDTKRTGAATSLRQVVERYRLAERVVRDAVWEWELETGVVCWNPVAAGLFRYKANGMMPRIEWRCERIHPEDRLRVLNSLQSTLDHPDQSLWSAKYRFECGDGLYVWVHDRAQVVRNGHSTPVRLVGSMNDISDQHRLEEANFLLGKAAGLMDTSLDYGSSLRGLARQLVLGLADFCALDALSADGDLHRAAVAHARPSEEVHLHDRFTFDNARSHRSLVQRTMERGEALLVTCLTPSIVNGLDPSPAEREDLEALDCKSLLITPMTVRGRITGAVTLGRIGACTPFGPGDLALAEGIANRIAMAVELEHLYQKAQRAVRARNEVLAFVSHDLRDPLNTIRMAAASMDLIAADAEKCVATGAMIVRTVDRMSGLVQNLLDATSLEAGGFVARRVPCETGQFLKDQLSALAGPAISAAVEFSSDVPDRLPAVWIDESQITRVLSNLVSNAAKFTPSGGRISLVARATDDSLEIAVADTGRGIPAAQIPHLFEGYWQARAGDHRGVGLGLTIADGIARAHGGKLDVKSEVDRGTTFTLVLPLATSPPTPHRVDRRL